MQRIAFAAAAFVDVPMGARVGLVLRERNYPKLVFGLGIKVELGELHRPMLKDPTHQEPYEIMQGDGD